MRRPLSALLFVPLLLIPCAVLAAEPSTGERLYQQLCASCHGVKLQGGNAQSLVDGVWQFGRGRGYVQRSIKYGIPHLGMPSYGESLSDSQIREVTNFLLESENRAGVTPPTLPERLETQDGFLRVEVLTRGLEIPWGIAFPRPGEILVTERAGRLRLLRDGVLLPDPVADTPAVLAEGQGGLLDVAADPNVQDNGWIYLAYSHALPQTPGQDRPGAMTRIVRGRIRNHTWTDQEVLFEAPHDTYRTTRHHYGCRIVFDPQGYLYFAIGDRGADGHAQELQRPNGKVHRIHRDGRIPADNPFIDREAALPSIYSYGHRNPQGLSVHPETGRLWTAEHGPMGGDELNLITPARNYGWPIVTYGVNYNGTVISEFTKKPGLEVPNYYWKPSTAVCGIAFIHGDRFPLWRNRLLVGSLKYEDIQLLDIEQDRVIHHQVILKNYGRVRAVSCGPDGAIYALLEQPGRVVRFTAE
jgi:glucose/arabinose dehydrogenase